MKISTIKDNIRNIPGWRTNRRIIVIESDDWGSIRMPSKNIYFKLQKEGFQPENDPYLKYDSLASEDDLNALFDVLTSVKDKYGNFAKITANCVVANPDFRKIEDSSFQEYFFEPFTQTLKRYNEHNNSFNLWKEGSDNEIFHPQFHGREHINVYNWLNDLQNKDLHKAFENEMISISSLPSKMSYGYMESLDYFTNEEKNTKNQILVEGLKLFNNIFKTPSKSFVANCYIWNYENEKILSKNGVKYIQSNPFQLIPNIQDNTHAYKKKYHYTGQKNNFGQKYIVRNVYFEPSNSKELGDVETILKKIEIAFTWKKPAIICSHRLNFIGYIDESNRAKNLRLFQNLLTKIIRKWPDVEFMTSDELGKVMDKKKNEK